MAAGDVTSKLILERLTSFVHTETKHQETNIVEDDGVSTSPVQSQPRNLKAFYARVHTYNLPTWSAKPLWLSPTQCARYGWCNVRPHLLQCVSCRSYLNARLPATADHGVVAACSERVLASLKNAHNKYCPWSTNPSPEHFLRLQLGSPVEVRTHFVAAVHALLNLDLQLPLVHPEVLDELSLDSIQLRKLKPLVAESDVDEEKEDAILSACLLAVCGWEARTDVGCATVACHLCERTVGLWSYFSFLQPQNEIDSDVDSPNPSASSEVPEETLDGDSVVEDSKTETQQLSKVELLQSPSNLTKMDIGDGKEISSGHEMEGELNDPSESGDHLCVENEFEEIFTDKGLIKDEIIPSKEKILDTNAAEDGNILSNIEQEELIVPVSKFGGEDIDHEQKVDDNGDNDERMGSEVCNLITMDEDDQLSEDGKDGLEGMCAENYPIVENENSKNSIDDVSDKESVEGVPVLDDDYSTSGSDAYETASGDSSSNDTNVDDVSEGMSEESVDGEWLDANIENKDTDESELEDEANARTGFEDDYVITLDEDSDDSADEQRVLSGVQDLGDKESTNQSSRVNESFSEEPSSDNMSEDSTDKGWLIKNVDIEQDSNENMPEENVESDSAVDCVIDLDEDSEDVGESLFVSQENEGSADPVPAVDGEGMLGQTENSQSTTEVVVDSESIPDPVVDSESISDQIEDCESIPVSVVDSESIPDPVVGSESIPDAVMDSESIPDPVVDSESIADPVVDSESIPDQMVDCESIPVSVVDSESIPDPVVDSESIPDAVMDSESIPDPVMDSESIADPVVDSESIPDQMVDCESIPVSVVDSESIPDPVVDSESIPDAVMDSESVPDPVVDSESIPDPVVDSESIPDAVMDSESIPDPVVDSESIPDPVVDSESIPDPVVDSESIPDPLVDSKIISNSVMDSESISDPVMDIENIPDPAVDRESIPVSVVDSESIPDSVVDIENIPDSVVDSECISEQVVNSENIPDPIVDSENIPKTILDSENIPGPVLDSEHISDLVVNSEFIPDPVVETLVTIACPSERQTENFSSSPTSQQANTFLKDENTIKKMLEDLVDDFGSDIQEKSAAVDAESVSIDPSNFVNEVLLRSEMKQNQIEEQAVMTGNHADCDNFLVEDLNSVDSSVQMNKSEVLVVATGENPTECSEQTHALTPEEPQFGFDGQSEADLVTESEGTVRHDEQCEDHVITEPLELPHNSKEDIDTGDISDLDVSEDEPMEEIVTINKNTDGTDSDAVLNSCVDVAERQSDDTDQEGLQLKDSKKRKASEDGEVEEEDTAVDTESSQQSPKKILRQKKPQRCAFNPVKQHWLWCPWVLSADGAEVGWQRVLNQLLQSHSPSPTTPTLKHVTNYESLREVRLLMKGWTSSGAD